MLAGQGYCGVVDTANSTAKPAIIVQINLQPTNYRQQLCKRLSASKALDIFKAETFRPDGA